jgi:hypothetical protein
LPVAGGDVRGIRGHRLWRSEEVSALGLLVEPQPWMADASCKSEDPQMFFGVNARAAKVICGRCAVQSDCRAWNDEVEAGVVTASNLYGIFAAETPVERAERRRRVGGGGSVEDREHPPGHPAPRRE